MYGASLYITVEEVDIGEIEKSWTGKNVIAVGNVTDYSRSGGHVFMTVKDRTGSIKVVNFDSEGGWKKGDRVKVLGHVEVYHGQLEIIAKEIEQTERNLP